jgi:hypothetical protein
MAEFILEVIVYGILDAIPWRGWVFVVLPAITFIGVAVYFSR